MLDVLYYYLIFAVSGGLLSVGSLFVPIRSMIRKAGLNTHPFLTSTALTTIVWFSMAVLCIPMLIRPLLMEVHRQTFITHTYQSSIAD
jgi:hypothetical protein